MALDSNYCGSGRSQADFLTRSASFPGWPAHTPFNASFVYQQTIKFYLRKELEEMGINPGDQVDYVSKSQGALRLQFIRLYLQGLRPSLALRTLHKFLYGEPLITAEPKIKYRLTRSALSLGRWMRHWGSVNYTKGSPSVLPTRSTCPDMFHNDYRRSICESPMRIEWRWMPFAVDQRHLWIYPPFLMKHCFWNNQPLIMGDSVGASLGNAMTCQSIIYGGMREFRLGPAASVEAFAIKLFNPLYPDKGGTLPTYEEYLWYRNQLPWDRKVKIVLWQMSLGPVSFTNSTLWYRGLDLFASFLARDKELFNISSYVATATPPQPLIHDGGAKTPGYYTRGRAFKWNWVLRKVMARWHIPVVDTWTPLESRFDERIDNIHYCFRGEFSRLDS